MTRASDLRESIIRELDADGKIISRTTIDILDGLIEDFLDVYVCTHRHTSKAEMQILLAIGADESFPDARLRERMLEAMAKDLRDGRYGKVTSD